VLTAEQSPEVAEVDEDGGALRPQLAEAERAAGGLRQGEIGEPGGEIGGRVGAGHGAILPSRWAACQRRAVACRVVDALTALQRRERTIAAVRWLAVLVAAAQVAFHVPPPDLEPLWVRPQGYALVAALAVVAVAAEAAVRTVRTRAALERVGAVLLAADVGIGLGFVWVYAFDPAADVWAVLTLLPLEGAVRFQLRGALATWAAVTPGLVAVDVAAPAVAASAARTAFQGAVLLAVALLAGTMARDLEQQRRLSAGVADAARQLLGRTEPAEVFRVLCREAVGCLGVRSAVVYVHDGQWYQAVASWPAESLVDVLEQDLVEEEDPDLAEHVRSGPLWLPSDGVHPGRLAIPLRTGGQHGSHVLVLRPRGGNRPSDVETQAAVSLAEAAGTALAAVHVLSAEQRTTRRLRYLEALRTRFVATVAHDLRHPLTVFKGVAAVLRSRRGALGEEQVDDMLASVERQANRLSRLADDLLDAARMDADRLILAVAPTRLRDVVGAITADSEEDVAVDLAGDPQLRADPARLERVLWNLLSNAEKYGRPPFAITGRCEGDEVVVAVRDHGPGLDEAQRGRLFSEFAGSGDPSSVGLGLAIVWRLVEAHGGTVAYEDADPGARFVVRLPVAGPPG
jgi:signal transduction histidine kinase